MVSSIEQSVRRSGFVVTASALLIIFLAASLNSCSKPTEPDANAYTELDPYMNEREPEQFEIWVRPKDVTDQALRALIANSLGRVGLNYYKLPNPMDPGQWDLIPTDPANPLHMLKITMGMYLFMDCATGINNVRPEGQNTYSCGSCHPGPAAFYANVAQGIGEGGSGFGVAGEGRTFNPAYDSNPDKPDVGDIRVPTVLNSAYQAVTMWDGKFGAHGPNQGTQSQWTPGTPLEHNNLGMHGLEVQAFAGLGVHRMEDIDSTTIDQDPQYLFLANEAFPSEPDKITRMTAALSIAAYERTILTDQAPFQRWLRGEFNAMTVNQKAGAALFFGKAKCVSCHNGPALNSMSFHALGMNDLDGSWDAGNVNLAPLGGTVPDATRRGRGGFTGDPADDYKFKTPQLYNLLDSPFYGHGGSFASVREVIEYKNAAIPQNPNVPGGQLSLQFVPLNLDANEIDLLTEFVEGALYDPMVSRFVAPDEEIPGDFCTPVNDPQSQIDLGCNPPSTPSVAALDLRRGPGGLRFQKPR